MVLGIVHTINTVLTYTVCGAQKFEFTKSATIEEKLKSEYNSRLACWAEFALTTPLVTSLLLWCTLTCDVSTLAAMR